ncbi:MAG: cupin domain-containing protein [Nitrospinae bacterium]|nr:cupin domain-containing protein [Nitrospinota bacterium]
MADNGFAGARKLRTVAVKNVERINLVPFHGGSLGCNVFGDGDAGLNMWRLLVAPGGSMESHFHPCPEIYYVARGAGDVSTGDGAVTRLEAGDALYIPANEPHRFVNNTGSMCEILAISFLSEPAPA